MPTKIKTKMGIDVESALAACHLCPRKCGVDRIAGERGYCRTGPGIEIGSICLHRGEEPGISGPTGICNVFFTHCNMQCVYCQNTEISRNTRSVPALIRTEEDALRRIVAVLDQGAHAVGFVSASHCLPQVSRLINALYARDRHPVTVWNTNAYEQVETLQAISGLIDVYLPDLKYADTTLANEFSDTPDYPQVAQAALREMFRQKGAAVQTDAEGQIRSGLLVRHLVLPGQLENTRRCLAFIAKELSPSVHVSLMAQYSPTPAVANHPTLGRALHEDEYEQAVTWLETFGLEHGWIQDLSSIDYYMPDFRQADPFDGS